MVYQENIGANTDTQEIKKSTKCDFSSSVYVNFLQELFNLAFYFKHGWRSISVTVFFSTKISGSLIFSPVNVSFVFMQ